MIILSSVASFIRTLRLPHTNCFSLDSLPDDFTHDDHITVEINKVVWGLYSLPPLLGMHDFDLSS